MGADDLGERREAAAGHGPPRSGPVLVLWVALTVIVQGGLWLAGFRTSALSGAVEQGAARVESVGVGVLDDDLIRKAIRTQHDTLPFWTVMAFLGDFLAEPLALPARAVAAATAYSALAALRGRAVGFDRALAGCAAAQGVWVLGLAVRAALMVALRRGGVETSAALLLPAGVHPAWEYLGLRQLDAFALAGWGVVAAGARGRGQVGWPGALAVAAVLGGAEAALRVVTGLAMGAAMRLSVMSS